MKKKPFFREIRQNYAEFMRFNLTSSTKCGIIYTSKKGVRTHSRSGKNIKHHLSTFAISILTESERKRKGNLK